MRIQTQVFLLSALIVGSLNHQSEAATQMSRHKPAAGMHRIPQAIRAACGFIGTNATPSNLALYTLGTGALSWGLIKWHNHRHRALQQEYETGPQTMSKQKYQEQAAKNTKLLTLATYIGTAAVGLPAVLQAAKAAQAIRAGQAPTGELLALALISEYFVSQVYKDAGHNKKYNTVVQENGITHIENAVRNVPPLLLGGLLTAALGLTVRAHAHDPAVAVFLSKLSAANRRFTYENIFLSGSAAMLGTYCLDLVKKYKRKTPSKEDGRRNEASYSDRFSQAIVAFTGIALAGKFVAPYLGSGAKSLISYGMRTFDPQLSIMSQIKPPLMFLGVAGVSSLYGKDIVDALKRKIPWIE